MRNPDIRCQVTPEGVALAIFGEITFDKGAEILTALDYFKGQHITLSVYSGGGDVFAATGIRDRIAQEDVTARVYGLAGSGAAFLLTGARRVEMAPFSSLMVHRAYKEDDQGNKIYDKDTDNINAMQVEMFAQRTGKRRDVVEKWLASGDKFFSAQEAVDMGLADAIYSGDKMAASLNDMKTMSEVIKEAEVPEPVAVVETPTDPTPEPAAAVEDPGDEQVEVEIPITTGEAIKAALAGKFKAKVNISAKYGEVIGQLTDELRSMRASLDEANAQVEALAPKAAEAEAATTKAAEAEAKVAEVVKEVEALKATPIEEPVKSTSDAAAVVPAANAPKPTKASEAAQAMARSMERMDRVLGITKN